MRLHFSRWWPGRSLAGAVVSFIAWGFGFLVIYISSYVMLEAFSTTIPMPAE